MTINHQPSTIQDRKLAVNYRQLVILMSAVSGIVFFACSSLRHALFQSNAYDLGWFDQFSYFLSQGKPPIVTFADYHLLGDHAAFIFYGIAILYKLQPDVHWLFAIQAIALSLGCWLVWLLALEAGLSESQSALMGAVYLLYPLVFNVNLYDFHPEVMAIPGIFAGVLAARRSQVGWFCFYTGIVLSCKAVLSLTVVAMGLWLLIFERKRWCGLIALTAGIAWFLIASQVIIPLYSGTEAAAVSRYSYLGNSVLEILHNLLFKPSLILGRVFSLSTLEYLLLLSVPLLWGLSGSYLTPLIAALPALVINILSELPTQRNIVHQYSVPILPFLILAVIGCLARGKNWLGNPRAILGWCLVCFLLLAKYGYFGSLYLEYLDTWAATRTAILQIDSQSSVLTSSFIAPHLTQRPNLKLAIQGAELGDLSQFDYVLLNQRHPGWASSAEVVNHLLARLQQSPKFELTYQRDGVFLFKKIKN